MYDFAPFSLASDNTSGVHPRLMEALQAVNHGYADAYCLDACNKRVQEMFCELFGRDLRAYMVLNGTGANVAALSALAGRGSAVVCPACAHINTHETGAADRLLGMKIMPLPDDKGKITPDSLEEVRPMIGNFHAANPDALSISNTTEWGTVYSPDELRALCTKAHAMGMKVHMDGARFANAVAALGCAPDAIAGGAGVDVLCFGGTKNGFMMGEAILFFDVDLAHRFDYLRKQFLQLSSKGRYIAAQFEAALTDDLWLDMGRNANAMAQTLSQELARIEGIDLVMPTQSNQVFLHMPSSWVEPLRKTANFLAMDDGSWRLVTSFDTTAEQVQVFIQAAQALSQAAN